MPAGGAPRPSLHRLPTNPLYIGKVKYKTEVHRGEQAAIVDPAVWHQVQQCLKRNAVAGGALVRNEFGSTLKGFLRCVPCGCSMTPAITTRNGTKRYR